MPRNGVAPSIVVVAVVIALLIGGIAGFCVGAASSKAGQALLRGAVQHEKQADVASPTKLARAGFELQYPSNWRVATDDDDYDPDHMFSIESPGSAFVMFVLGAGGIDAEETLKEQIKPMQRLMGSAAIQRFEKYGRLAGKGATLTGKIMGVKTTVRVFAYVQDDQTVMITQQCADEDLAQAAGGLDLIERSFALKSPGSGGQPKQPGAGGGR